MIETNSKHKVMHTMHK